jgi:hypothetical protein
MSYILENQIFFAFIVDGMEKAWPITPALLRELYVIENVNFVLPMFRITFYDTLGIQAKTGMLADGKKVSIILGPSSEEEEIYQMDFRIFGRPEQKDYEPGPSITVSGYADVPKYWRKRVDKAYKGTSSEVIKKIAEECSMTAVVDQTKDKMIWLPDSRAMGNFAREVCDHGWVSNTSCMMLGVANDRGKWQARYRDISVKPKKVGKFSSPRPDIKNNIYDLQEFNIRSPSGFFNNIMGYGYRLGQEDLTGKYNEYEKIQMNKQAPYLEMNKDLYKDLGVVRREVHPIDCGNTHAHYAEAQHKNSRLRSMFNSIIEGLTTNYTDLNILDGAKLELISTQDYETDQHMQGDYLITGKTMMITSTYYREKFRFVAPGTFEDGSSVRLAE